MKVNCGPDREERYLERERQRALLKQWHSFFAILPKRVGARDCRWMEFIERRFVRYTYSGYPIWEYRAKQDSINNNSGLAPA